MNYELLCVTFRRDIEYCRYMLRSVKKFARGFSGVTLAVPNEDVPAFTELALEIDYRMVSVVGYADVPGKGMLQHMVKVCEADLLCPSADFIFHIDSDCLFREPVTPHDFFHGSKPVLLYEPYATINHAGRLRWKKAVEDALGGSSEHEFMCRHPAVHYRWLYQAAREAMTRHVGDWKADWLAGPNIYPQERCEYSTLGEVVWREFRDEYQLELNDERYKDKGKIKQLWTHCPVDSVIEPETETQREKMEKILA